MSIRSTIRRLTEPAQPPLDPTPTSAGHARAAFGTSPAPQPTDPSAIATARPETPGVGVPATPTVSDTRGRSGVWPDAPVGPQPVLPTPSRDDLPYGVTTLGARDPDGRTR